ncbi:MAG: DUF58 domain-containing protein [Chloroflexi bacterium]|nr:DUF58 domain-containing protein [Chloroflexota bacterium]
MTSGRLFVLLLLAVGGIGTMVNGSVHYVRLLYLGILLLAVAWVMTTLSLQGIALERRARSSRAGVGDVLEEHFEIANNSRTTKLWLEIANETNIPNATGSRVITLLPGRQKRSYTARTWLTARGGFTLGPTVLTSGDPFGIFRVSKQFPATASLVVFPMLFPVNDFISPPGLLPGGKAIRRKAMDVTPHASGIREYIPGDPMKRIHWTTSIRRGQLMVKEFEQDPQAEVWFFLDTHKAAHISKPVEPQDEPSPLDDLFLIRRRKVKLPPSTLEYSISITASLAHYFIGQRRSVGMVTASERSYTVIPAERSERQEGKILEALAFLRGESAITLPSLVSAQIGQLPQGSSAILVTPMPWHELLLAVDSLQRRNLRPVVVLLMTKSFGGRQGNEELAQSLTERKIPVCPVYCDADLSETLSRFSAHTFSQEAAWRQPVLSHLT